MCSSILYCICLDNDRYFVTVDKLKQTFNAISKQPLLKIQYKYDSCFLCPDSLVLQNDSLIAWLTANGVYAAFWRFHLHSI